MSTTENDCTCGCASASTRTERLFVAVAPRASPTVSPIVATWSPPAPVSACWKTTSPSGVAATCPMPDSSVAENRITGSPSGSTQSPSTGTLTVPPVATSGVGHSCWHPSTPHHSGAEFSSSATTVSVTVASDDSRPSGVVPSDTAYENVATPVASAATRTAKRCRSSVIESVPNAGSSPCTDAGSIASTSSLGSWSFSSTGSDTSAPGRTPKASSTATGGRGSMTAGGSWSVVFGAVSTGSSRSQFWLDGTRRPSGTVHTQPERASLSTSPSPAPVKPGRRCVGSVASPYSSGTSPPVEVHSVPGPAPSGNHAAYTVPSRTMGRAAVPREVVRSPNTRSAGSSAVGTRTSPVSSARYTPSPSGSERETATVPDVSADAPDRRAVQ